MFILLICLAWESKPYTEDKADGGSTFYICLQYHILTALTEPKVQKLLTPMAQYNSFKAKGKKILAPSQFVNTLLSLLVFLLTPCITYAQEAYGVLIDGTLTIYYDDMRDSREGETFGFYSNAPEWAFTESVKKFTNVIFDTSISEYRPTYLEYLFYNCSKLKTIEGLHYLNTSEVISMDGMFWNCTSLTNLDVSNFETSNVTNMARMFCGCKNLINLDVSNFNTSNVTNMWSMFNGCSNLTNLDVSNFNTNKVTDMYMMFGWCSSLTSLNVSSFTTSNVVNMSSMFSYCNNIKSFDLSGFDTRNVTDMSGMFHDCKSLTSLNLDNFNTENVTDMTNMFYGCSNLTNLDLSNFKTKEVKNMCGMFQSCNNLININLSGFDTRNVTNMSGMFSECKSLTSLNLDNFDTSNVTSMHQMFWICSSLGSLNLKSFNTSKVTNMCEMFSGCENLISLNVSSFNTSNVTTMRFIFSECSNLANIDVSNFDTSNVTDMCGMFKGTTSLSNLYIDFETKKVENMGQMFGFSGITSIELGKKITTILPRTFYWCENLSSVILGENISSIDDLAFSGCLNINTIKSNIDNPFAFVTSAFEDDVYPKATLIVPANTKSQYQSTEGWKEFKNIIEVGGGDNNDGLEPINEGDNTDYGNGEINDGTDLNGNVIGNIYYNISDENGEYSSAEGCIILRKPTTDEKMNEVVGMDLFGEDIKNNYTGIIFMVQAGSGTIKVNAETVGSMTLKVKIGNNAPATMELEGKMKASFPYTVTEPTYVYIYGGETTLNNARGMRRAEATENALKIYGIEWSESETPSHVEAIRETSSTDTPIYNLNGQRVEPTSKGIYIKNRKKVLVK